MSLDNAQHRQSLLTSYLQDPHVEDQVRKYPEEAAATYQVDLPFVRWLSTLDPRRVAAFRKSQVHKEQVRASRR